MVAKINNELETKLEWLAAQWRKLGWDKNSEDAYIEFYKQLDMVIKNKYNKNIINSIIDWTSPLGNDPYSHYFIPTSEEVGIAYFAEIKLGEIWVLLKALKKENGW